MIIKIGAVEFDVEIKDKPGINLLDATLRQLKDETLVATPRQTPVIEEKKITLHATQVDAIEDLALLKYSKFTTHTLVMIARKLLGVSIRGTELIHHLSSLTKKATAWVTRQLDEEIWCIYAGSVEVPKLGTRFVATGLNKKNQLVFLGMVRGSAKILFQDLTKRGLDPLKVKLGLLSLTCGSEKDFLSIFKKAKIQRDWNEFLEKEKDEDAREAIKSGMLASDEEIARAVIEDHDLPEELLTYYSFNKKLWRALRTANSIFRIEKDLRSRTTGKIVKTEEQVTNLVAWALLRLQYHWFKIPVDADQLSNLRYIKLQLAEAD